MPDLKTSTLFGTILEFIVGFAKYILAFIVLILILSYFILKNVIALPVIQHFSADQYFQNIIHFHRDCYGYINDDVDLFDSIMNMKDRERSDNHLTLHRGNMFLYKGKIEKENVEWIAAVVYKEQKPYYGYFVVPKENRHNYYRVQSRGFYISVEDYRKRDDKYLNELNNSNIKIMKAEGGLQMQEIRESDKYLVLWSKKDSQAWSKSSPDEVLFYCDRSYASLANAIRDKYYRKNEKEVFLDIANRWQ